MLTKNDGMSVTSGIYHVGAQTKGQKLASGSVRRATSSKRSLVTLFWMGILKPCSFEFMAFPVNPYSQLGAKNPVSAYVKPP